MIRSSNRICRDDIDTIIIKAILETWILHKQMYIGVIIVNDEHASGSWQTLTVFGKVFLLELFHSGNQTLVESSNWVRESWPSLPFRPTYETSKILESLQSKLRFWLRFCGICYNSFSIFKFEFGPAKTFLRSAMVL